MTARDGQFLDCRLAVDHGGDKFSVAGLVLRADDNVVPVEDARIDHRLAAHLEHEQIAVSGHGCGKTENVLHVLLSRDGSTRSDTSNERNRRAFLLDVGDGDLDANDLLSRLRRRGDAELGARPIGEVEGARQAGLADQVAVGLKCVKVMLHRRGRRQTDCRCDLAHRRREAAGCQLFVDNSQDRAVSIADRTLGHGSPSHRGGRKCAWVGVH